MGSAGFSVGTFTGGGTFHIESQGGTYTPVGVMAWGGAGTVTRVGPTAAAAMPVNVAGGTLNAGTVTVANTGTVAGTVGLSGGTISTIAAGTIAISTIAAGTVVATNTVLSVVGGGGEATAQRVTIANDSTGVLSVDDNGGVLTVDGTVVAAGTQTVAGTVVVSTIAAGTVVATAAGTQVVSGTVSQTLGQGKTLSWGTVNLTTGSVSLVNPGTGTVAYIVSMTLSAGTVGIIQFLQGVGAAALSGPIPLDQYGGFVSNGQPSSPILKSASGSQVYLQITSGIGTLGGFYSYFVE